MTLNAAFCDMSLRTYLLAMSISAAVLAAFLAAALLFLRA